MSKYWTPSFLPPCPNIILIHVQNKVSEKVSEKTSEFLNLYIWGFPYWAEYLITLSAEIKHTYFFFFTRHTAYLLRIDRRIHRCFKVDPSMHNIQVIKHLDINRLECT